MRTDAQKTSANHLTIKIFLSGRARRRATRDHRGVHQSSVIPNIIRRRQHSEMRSQSAVLQFMQRSFLMSRPLALPYGKARTISEARLVVRAFEERQMFHGSLRAFDETARAGSIRKASEALGVAPSSVSRHIAILERQMGTALLVRRAGGVDLTHAGALVAEYVRKLLVDHDSLRADLDDLRGARRRLVRLAVVESIAAAAPNAVNRFNRRFPAVSFNIRRMPAPAVAEAVRDGKCEIGLSYCVEPDPELVALARIGEPVMLAVRAEDRLANGGEVSLEQVSRMPLGLPDVDFGVRQIVDKAAAALGVRLEPILASNDFGMLRRFVRCGAGVALLPMRAISHSDEEGRLIAVPVAEAAFKNATIDLIVLRKRRVPRVLQAFIESLIGELGATAPATEEDESKPPSSPRPNAMGGNEGAAQ
jgi:DNA-binding transcriptional LysR family regulator